MEKETKIQTLSLIAGTEACNARCPFCVSKMTPVMGVNMREEPINWERFKEVMGLAKEGNVDTVMITGKGEPTLFPGHVSGYLTKLDNEERSQGFQIGAKELQTNGILFERKREHYEPLLSEWKEGGLGTIAISIVHFEADRNREIYLPYSDSYIDLPSVIGFLHGFGFRTRLACILVNGFIDSPDKLDQLIEFARRNESEELTVRPVNKPEETRNDEVFNWIDQHHLEEWQLDSIANHLNKLGTVQKQFPYGATVYDVDGQNVCLTNSLTRDDGQSYMRQLIFYPSGRIATDWTEEGETQ